MTLGIVKRTEDEPTRSSLSHDYTRPFRHIPFSAYPSAASKVLAGHERVDDDHSGAG